MHLCSIFKRHSLSATRNNSFRIIKVVLSLPLPSSNRFPWDSDLLLLLVQSRIGSTCAHNCVSAAANCQLPTSISGTLHLKHGPSLGQDKQNCVFLSFRSNSQLGVGCLGLQFHAPIEAILSLQHAVIPELQWSTNVHDVTVSYRFPLDSLSCKPTLVVLVAAVGSYAADQQLPPLLYGPVTRACCSCNSVGHRMTS